MTPPPKTTFGPGDLPPPASVRLDTDSARRLLGALGAAERDGLEAGDFDGVVLPGYTLVRRLGAGASGEVFLALREGSDRPVSVKVWRQGQRGERAVRAWRELDLLGECNLSVVPRVLDYGTRAGSLFVATDFIDGLDPISRAQGMSLRERVTLLADIADAVQMLHEHGIIHRDLKPANILVTAAGRVFILDLGLAMLAQRTADTLTLEGQPVGTLGYMSPEQARGERAKVSVRSDVYSLGAIGYHLLCGDTPHRMSESASQSLLRITMTPPRDPRAMSAEVPPALAAVLAKAVRAEPRKRYASAAEFATDLCRWVRGERVLTAAPTVWERAVTWMSGHPRVATAVACASIVLMTVLSVYAITWWTLRQPYKLVQLTGVNANQLLGVRLVSRSGNPLHDWPNKAPGMIWASALADRPRSLGGGQLVLLAYGYAEQPGVFAFDAAQPDGPPVWSSGFGLGDFVFPPGVPLDHTPNFGAVWMRLEDIFPESEGDEVVAIHNHTPLGYSVLRIYNLSGTVLFEAWHPGHLRQTRWLSEDRVLVACGDNDEVPWKCRGFPECEHPWPVVVFGIKPDLGGKHAWITTPSRGGDFTPEWYKCVLPPVARDQRRDEQTEVGLADLANRQLDPGRHFAISVCSFTLYVNSHGKEVDRQEWISTTQATDARLGDRLRSEDVMLGELPGIVSGCDPNLGDTSIK